MEVHHQRNGRYKKRHVYLFNDMILECRKTMNGFKNNSFVLSMPLEESSRISTFASQPNSNDHDGLSILNHSGAYMNLKFDSADEMKEWKDSIESTKPKPTKPNQIKPTQPFNVVDSRV